MSTIQREPQTAEFAAAALVAAAPEPMVSRVRRRLSGLARPPKPAPGLELIGPMEGSGFEQTPYLVRRADGQVVQLPELLYIVLEGLEHRGGYNTLSHRVTEQVGAQLEADDARFLVNEKLAPLGLTANGRAQAPAKRGPKSPNDLLALTWKARVVPANAVSAITSLFRPLFYPPVVLFMLGAFFALEAWFLTQHGIAQSVRAVLYQPSLLVLVFAGVIVATAFHELGHATACRYSGARPGVLGIGLYLIWPVFYTDVTDAYRLGRVGRLRTDLGGIYFNSIFAMGCAGAYFATRWEPILLLVLVQTFTIIQQLLPLGRLDGYLILTDLTGVPDLLSRMKPILRSMIPGRAHDERVRDLKPWVRRVASGYIAFLIPVLLFIIAMMLIHAPRVFATAYDSLGVRWALTRAAFDHGRTGTGAGELLQCAALVLPGLGMAVTSVRLGRRVGGAALGWSAAAPARRVVVVTATAALAGATAYAWSPSTDYRPLQPGERGTLQAGVHSLGAVASGHPALSAGRVVQLGGAPTQVSRLHARQRGDTGKQSGPGQNGNGAPGGTTTDPAGTNTGTGTGRQGTGTTTGTSGTTTSPSGGTTTAPVAAGPSPDAAPAPTDTSTGTGTTTTGTGTTGTTTTGTTTTDTSTTTSGTTTTP